MNIERVLLVHKKSLYRLYVEEHRDEAVRHALRRGDPTAQRMRRSHETQRKGLDRVQRVLRERGIEVVLRWRAQMRSAQGCDLVISFGGDGTLLDTSHRVVDGPPLLGINSDPDTSVGALCAGTVDALPQLIDALRGGQLRPRPMARIRVRVDGKPVLGPALNDILFAHASPAEMTRYEMGVVRGTAVGRRSPGDLGVQRSSGVWVATPAGSTAAIRSAGGHRLPYGSRRLQYVIREPYVAPSRPSPRGAVRGFVDPGHALVIISRMRRGMVWLDGPHRRIHVDFGQQVMVDHHPNKLLLVLPRS